MENGNLVATDLIDEMEKVKSDFKILSTEIIEDMLKDMTEKEKDTLLRLYIYAER